MKKTTLTLYFFALLIRICIALPFIHDWDGFVFSESAKNLLRGETPYQTAAKNSPDIYPDSDRPQTEQWYAYPPLPLLMFTAPVALINLLGAELNQSVFSVLLKMPFIAGDLVAARLIYLFLKKGNSSKASLAEKLILFNPLLIWVSSAWGMFDIWLFNFILLSVMSASEKKWKLTGLSFALSICIKLFPAFLLPIFARLIWHETRKSKQRIMVLIAFITTLAIVNIPFFLSSPHGFINQNLLMHLVRPAQGLSLSALIDTYGYIYDFSTQWLTAALSLVMLFFLSVIYLYALSIRVNAERFIFLSSLVYISILLFNKVTNEQYFVVIVCLLLLYIFLNPDHSKGMLRAIRLNEIAATLGALIGGFFLGFHFISFLLPRVASRHFDASTNQLVYLISKSFNLPLYIYPDNVFTFYNLPIFLTTIAMIPFYTISFYMLYVSIPGFIAQIYHGLKRSGTNFLNWGSKNASRKTWLYHIASVSLVIIILFAGSNLILYLNSKYSLLTPITLLSGSDYSDPPVNPTVGIFYNVWWNNFSHNINYPYDSWNFTTLTPNDGYYTSKNSYFVKHIREIKQAGIDFAVISYHLYDRNRYITFASYADKMGINYSPLIEIGDALNYDQYRPTSNEKSKFLGFNISDASKKQVELIIISSLSKTHRNPGHLRINGKPVVFLYDSHWFFPSWDPSSKRKLAYRIIDLYSNNQAEALSVISKQWGEKIESIDDLVKYYPADILGFNESTPQAKDFRKAFLEEYKKYWNDIRRSVERQMGQIYIIASYTPDRANWKEYAIHADDFKDIKAFNAEFFYSPANTWSMYRFSKPEDRLNVWIDQVGEQAERAAGRNVPLFVPVIPQYDDTKIRKSLGFKMPPTFKNVSLYDTTWYIASEYKADYVLITSWNEYFEGTAIQPSKEIGDRYLKETKRWTQQFKRESITVKTQ